MLYATVRQRKIYVKKPTTVIQNGVGVDELTLDMDAEWGSMDSIICVFTLKYTESTSTTETGSDGNTTTKITTETKEITKQMLHTYGTTLLVPWECLVRTGLLSVSCTGYVGSTKIMTTMLPDSFWNVVQNGAITGDESIDPTPTLYQQIIAAAGEANTAAATANAAAGEIRAAAAAGEYDGVSPTVEIASVTTGAAGSSAEVTNSGTPAAVKLNFVIPRGAVGPTGAAGRDGTNGTDGRDGTDGVSPTAYVEQTDTGAVVTVTDANGTTKAELTNGKDGAAGKDGANGRDGADGNTPTITASKSGTTTTIKADGTVIAEIEDGAQGEQGKSGADGYSPAAKVVKSGAKSTITITDKSGTTTAEVEDGAQGEPGKDGTSVEISGISESTEDGGSNIVTFSDGKTLTVKNGNKGSTGAAGKDGTNGTNGTDGVTPSFSIGTVETLAAGSDATASITGTDEKPVLNLGIPKGADGSGGGGSETWELLGQLETTSAVSFIEVELSAATKHFIAEVWCPSTSSSTAPDLAFGINGYAGGLFYYTNIGMPTSKGKSKLMVEASALGDADNNWLIRAYAADAGYYPGYPPESDPFWSRPLSVVGVGDASATSVVVAVSSQNLPSGTTVTVYGVKEN